MEPMFASIMTTILIKLPIYLIWIVGIIIAIVNLKRKPPAAALALIALVIMFFASGVNDILNVTIPTAIARGQISALSVSPVLIFKGVLFVFIDLICWILILLAIFLKRKPATASLPPVPPVPPVL